MHNKYYTILLKLVDLFNNRYASIGRFEYGAQWLSSLQTFVFLSADQLELSTSNFESNKLKETFKLVYKL